MLSNNALVTSRPRPVLADLAKGLGIDMSKYGACMDAETHRAQIQANLMEAERRQVNQTPTFIIGDKLVPGAIPYDQFRKLVDDELAKTPGRNDTGAGFRPLGDTAAKKAGAK